MDRFDAMAMFLAAVDHGSLSAAARALKVPVPTLSRKVADLEAVLGTQLLTRTTRKLSLTDAGHAYAGAARRILEQVEEAERAAAGEFVAPRGGLCSYMRAVSPSSLRGFDLVLLEGAVNDRPASCDDAQKLLHW